MQNLFQYLFKKLEKVGNYCDPQEMKKNPLIMLKISGYFSTITISL